MRRRSIAVRHGGYDWLEFADGGSRQLRTNVGHGGALLDPAHPWRGISARFGPDTTEHRLREEEHWHRELRLLGMLSGQQVGVAINHVGRRQEGMIGGDSGSRDCSRRPGLQGGKGQFRHAITCSRVVVLGQCG